MALSLNVVLLVAALAAAAALQAAALPTCAAGDVTLSCDPESKNADFCSLATAGDHCSAQCVESFPADPCLLSSWTFHRGGQPLRDIAGVGAFAENLAAAVRAKWGGSNGGFLGC